MKVQKLLKILILIGCLTILLSSCISSQKRLQRRIEHHGIKESISFVALKYPEYFKADSVTVHDTISIRDTIRIKADSVNVILNDSNGVLSFSDSLVSIRVNTSTNKAKIVIKERLVVRTDSVYVSIPCPEVTIPNVESLQSNIESGSGFGSGWVWYLVAFLIGLYAKRLIGFVKP